MSSHERGEDVPQAVGRVLVDLRREAALSQESLAARAGMHRTYVSDVERGHRNPTVRIVAKWLRALGVTWKEFGARVDREAGGGG